MTTLARLLGDPAAERLALVLLHFLWQGLIVADRRLCCSSRPCAGLRPARATLARARSLLCSRRARWRPSPSCRRTQTRHEAARVSMQRSHQLERACASRQRLPTRRAGHQRPAAPAYSSFRTLDSPRAAETRPPEQRDQIARSQARSAPG